jgi:hypothetical protein
MWAIEALSSNPPQKKNSQERVARNLAQPFAPGAPGVGGEHRHEPAPSGKKEEDVIHKVFAAHPSPSHPS